MYKLIANDYANGEMIESYTETTTNRGDAFGGFDKLSQDWSRVRLFHNGAKLRENDYREVR